MSKLQQLRIERNLTLEDVALSIGYKYKSSYNEVEKGRVQLKASKIKKLAELFSCSIIEIIEALIELE